MSPDRAECDMFDIILDVFLANSGRVCGQGASFGCGSSLLSPNNFTQDHLLKIEWLFVDVTPVGPPDRAERAVLGMVLEIFGQSRQFR